MNGRYLVSVCGLLVVGLLGALPAPAVAQGETPAASWAVPRTADGQPDLQGVWANNNATPLERPDAWAGKRELTAEELAEVKASAARVTESGLDAVFGDQLINAAIAGIADADSYDPTTGNYNQFWLVDRDISSQTSLVIDPPEGRIPPLTEAASRAGEAARAYRRDHPADGPEDRSLGERCANFGVPRLGAGYNSYTQIFQTPGHVALYAEMAHDVRVIPMDRRPALDDGVRQWNGASRGRWDGDTLVVETANFSDKSNFRSSTTGLHLVERFTRVAPDILHYDITITDPTQWTRPWTVRIPLKKSEDAVYEYACHEGNYGMEGILAGHRAQEKAPAASK